jgi:hypothetical protein
MPGRSRVSGLRNIAGQVALEFTPDSGALRSVAKRRSGANGSSSAVSTLSADGVRRFLPIRASSQVLTAAAASSCSA